MKKFASKLLVLVMVLTMGLGMVACGSKGYDTVADYINSDTVQKELETAKEAIEGSGMNLTITADGNKLVYTYKYDDVEKMDGMAEQLESAMSAQDSTFQNVADEMAKVVSASPVSVVIEYVDCNDEMIYSKEYTSSN